MPQFLMVDLLGTEISEEEASLLKHPNVGALILFSRNFKNSKQLQELIASIHCLRPDIFIAVDHEGGVVQRFQRHGFRTLPAARVYGDVYDLNSEVGLQLAEQYGELMATDLLAYGIDLSLAPVLDLHGASTVIGRLDRAFHADPAVVSQLGAAFIRGMHQAGMPAVAKHFPGHAPAISDSHLVKPVVDLPFETLKANDLKPFIELINSQLLDAVMPAHVTYSAVDNKYPAGFSTIWLQAILRDTLKFRGLVLSDCLSMVGADIGDMNQRAQQALAAGCDMLIVCNQPRAVLAELVQQEIFNQTAAALERIHQFKSRMARFSTDKKETPAQVMQPLRAAEESPAADNSGLLLQSPFNQTTSV